MKDKQKQAIRGMRQGGLPYAVIADSLALSPNTIKSFCRRENIGIQSNLNDKNPSQCKNCGAPLKHHQGSKKKTFCCDKCRYTWWNKNRAWTSGKGAYHLTCFHCGNEFYSNNKKQKFCSRECYIHGNYEEGLP